MSKGTMSRDFVGKQTIAEVIKTDIADIIITK